MEMKVIRNFETGGERPFFAQKMLRLENVIVHEGESALKECSDIVAEGCIFEGRYPFWHNERAEIYGCRFTIDSRAPLWYSRDLLIANTLIESPKTFREMDNLTIEQVEAPEAVEMLWHCNNVKLKNVKACKADYFMLNSNNIEINKLYLQGKYSFQYCNQVVIRNSILDTKDAFWMTRNVLIEDSEVRGEYLAWHSNDVILRRCHITGTQPFCYAHNLVLEDCTFGEDADLAFEYSSVNAVVNSRIASVKNPLTGSIKAKGYGEIILDENIKAPGDCKITVL